MTDKIYKRKCIEEIKKYLNTKETLILYGARQVGKTTIMKALMQNEIKENVFYLDLEFQHLVDMCNEGVERVYNYILDKGADKNKKIYLFLDEIQYLKDPTKFIKICHDHYPTIKLIVSGSSTFEIKRKLKQSLVGRTITFTIYPLTFEEFLEFKDKKYVLKEDNLPQINKELIPLAEEFIRYGGYPHIVLSENEELKETRLFQIISTYIKKDIREIGNIRNIDGFNKLLQILAQQSGNVVNILELSNTLDMKRETILEYLEILENTFIIQRITPFHKNIRTEVSKNPKVFVLDTGMIHLLWLKQFPKVIHGSVFETFVFLELLKIGKELHFWRTTNKQEVDFIIDDKELIAVEAKYQFIEKRKTYLPTFKKHYPCKTYVVGLQGEKTGKYPWELVKEVTK